MSWSTSLYIGNSFAEASVQIGSEILSQRRFLPQSSTKKFLQDLVKDAGSGDLGTLNITSKFPGQVLHKLLGSAPAFLVTSGFEHWLDINLPIKVSHFSVQPEKVSSPLDLDLVFGISERVSSKGVLEKQAPQEDLEFIVAKLKMLNVNQVAIGFLHAARNPKNEKSTAKFFKDQGFEVFVSHEMLPTENEKSRWWQAYLNAYLSIPCIENRDELASLAEELGFQAIKYCEADLVEQKTRAKIGYLPAVFDPCFIVAEALKQKKIKRPVVYFGLEDFWLFSDRKGSRSSWSSELGEIVIATPWVDRLKIQPTSFLQDHFWGVPTIAKNDIGYQPGPIAMGKGQRVTTLDILFVNDCFGIKDIETPVDGLTDLLSFKTKPRINETLQVLSKQALEMGDSSGAQVGEWVMDTILDELAMELSYHTDGQNILSVGPLAQVMTEALKNRKSGLEIQMLEDGCPYILSHGLLATSE